MPQLLLTLFKKALCLVPLILVSGYFTEYIVASLLESLQVLSLSIPALEFQN